jgi:hypothetical protein
MKGHLVIVLLVLILSVSLGPVMADRTSARILSKTADLKTKETVSEPERIESRRERDPFLLPQGVLHLSAVPKELSLKRDEKTKDIPLPSLEVKAILISDRLRLAFIDRQIVTVGDLIRDERVLEIQRDRVVLGKEDKKRSLFLKQSPVRIIPEEGERKGEHQ